MIAKNGHSALEVGENESDVKQDSDYVHDTEVLNLSAPTPSMPEKRGPSRFQVAVDGAVPPRLVGRSYKTFTSAEHEATLDHRQGNQLCLACGHQSHTWEVCYFFQSKSRKREKNRLCTWCKSSRHGHAKCPRLRKLEQRNAPYASEDMAPWNLEGLSYKAILEDKDKQKQLEDFRREKNMCLDCGPSEHHKFNCARRAARIEKAYHQKLVDIATGKIKLNLELTGYLTRLPDELLIRIFEECMRENYSIRIQPGYLDGPLRMLRAGLPFQIVFPAWIKANYFTFEPEFVYRDDEHDQRFTYNIERFKALVERYDCLNYVTRVDEGELGIYGQSRLLEIRKVFPRISMLNVNIEMSHDTSVMDVKRLINNPTPEYWNNSTFIKSVRLAPTRDSGRLEDRSQLMEKIADIYRRRLKSSGRGDICIFSSYVLKPVQTYEDEIYFKEKEDPDADLAGRYRHDLELECFIDETPDLDNDFEIF